MSVYVGIDVHRKRCEEDPEEQSGQPGDTTQSHWSDSLCLLTPMALMGAESSALLCRMFIHRLAWSFAIRQSRGMLYRPPEYCLCAYLDESCRLCARLFWLRHQDSLTTDRHVLRVSAA